MNKFPTFIFAKNFWFLVALFPVLLTGNQLVAQDCFTLYGVTGEPAGGLTRDLCSPTPGFVVIDASAASAVAYTWSTGAFTNSIFPVTGGTYTVTVSAFAVPVACVLDFVVSAHVNPIISLGNDTSYCSGDSYTIKAPPGHTSYSWPGQTSTTDSLVVSTPGSYRVIVTDSNTCVGTDTVTIVQNILPVTGLGPDVSVCTGDSILLDAGAGFLSYNWNTGDTTSSIGTNVIGTYAVTVTDTNLCVGSDQMIFDNFIDPTVNIGLDDTLCANLSKTLDAGAGFTTYLWSDASSAQTANFSVTSDPWVEVIDVNGCMASDTMHLEVNPLPNLNLGADDSICASQGYSLNAGNPNNSIASYLWSTGSTNQTISILADPSLVVDQTVSYSVTITDTNGCVNADTMILSTFILPIPDLGNDTSFCTGEPFFMVLDPGVFTSYAWSNGSNAATIGIGAVGMAYDVTVTDARGCVGDDGMVVTKHNLPFPNLGPDESFCEGSNFTKILNPGSFETYLWDNNSTGQVQGVSTAGTYSVTVTDINGCEENDEIDITENPQPIVDLGADEIFCEDVSVNHILDATTLLVGGTTYDFLWSNTKTAGIIVAVNFGNYTVVVTNELTNCFASSSMDILAMEKAAPDLGDDGQVCTGQLVNLDPQVTINGYNYLWSNGATTATVNIFETGMYWVQMDAQNGTCMGLTDTVYYSPGVLPVVELGEDQFVCEGQNVKLLNAATAFPDAIYLWQDGSTAKSFTAVETGTYEVEVENNCGSVVDQVYLEFQDCSNVYIPNTFTPNDDGRNDVFFPATDQEFAEYGFWIYDRWGSLLFKTNQPNFGWDGKVNGDNAPVGSYVWRISYVSSFQEFGVRVEKTGEFNLIR